MATQPEISSKLAGFLSELPKGKFVSFAYLSHHTGLHHQTIQRRMNEAAIYADLFLKFIETDKGVLLASMDSPGDYFKKELDKVKAELEEIKNLLKKKKRKK